MTSALTRPEPTAAAARASRGQGEPRPFEWAAEMARTATRHRKPAQAALAALRAIWAGEGTVVVRERDVVATAQGGPWSSLAEAAWEYRNRRSFAHPHLADALAAASWAPAGSAASIDWQARAWSSCEHRGAIATVYPGVLTGSELALLEHAGTGARLRSGGGTVAGLGDDALSHRLATLTRLAGSFWWPHYALTDLEPLEVHRHGRGTMTPPHADRRPVTADRALYVLAMIRPARTGGAEELHIGTRLAPELEPGDVLIFDAGTVHAVDTVTDGERVAIVTRHRFGRP